MYMFICSNVDSIGKGFERKFEETLKKDLEYLFWKFKCKDGNKYWIILNSYEIKNELIKKDIQSIQTYDSENLFTNIPIPGLKNIFLKIVDDTDLDLNLFKKLCNFCLYNIFVYLYKFK